MVSPSWSEPFLRQCLNILNIQRSFQKCLDKINQYSQQLSQLYKDHSNNIIQLTTPNITTSQLWRPSCTHIPHRDRSRTIHKLTIFFKVSQSQSQLSTYIILLQSSQYTIAGHQQNTQKRQHTIVRIPSHIKVRDQVSKLCTTLF